METRILGVTSSEIRFSPRSTDGHPYDDPVLEMDEPTKSTILEAASKIQDDQVISFPTETVYGLGANALSSEAVSKIYAAKNRPPDNPLILHISSLKSLRALLPSGESIPSIYDSLIAAFWPGPLTIILPLDQKSSGISPLCTSGQSTFAVRMPSHPLALALLHASGVPLAAPSANTSTRPSPTTAQHVHHDLKGLIPIILDGGPCSVGLESTVVDGTVRPPQVLRPGGLSIEQIRAVPGWSSTILYRPTATSVNEVPRTPGMKYRHYSPTARIVLFESTAAFPTAESLAQLGVHLEALAICRTRRWPIGMYKCFGPNVIERALGHSGQLISRNLFAVLRDLDDRAIKAVLVEGIAEGNEGLAVMNRLRKAATVVIH
ncbi:SUA5/yciO/yrdC family protein [Taphrina deformans PYCC 5710]|uniref:Threonylcarbamoyl-AMP synthase n=1 Tax=Taphrina deformans (strain PYCC 5710 / ATCC 11124 / CBS 356.35 / IMI 108563 / JCM 9778 / NBRC 8474) TaxID=1097556 RepID=R4X9S7_TAPDE|nr:SUA5/yciO/yrdC family protein [Taphrina deformans PYCC 5710]|eukprot:CCG82526.1 SUA5/yciO/yrdC family protein [Taphrina deformans PYCC 5710]